MLLTIAVPIYNVEKYLEKCLDSIVNQTFTDIEIICVDDCSPDNSEKIVKKYALHDPRVKLIRHEKNLGLGGARNTGIRAAKAEYIASVDSDDTIEVDMLDALWKATENGVMDVVCCGFDKRDEKGHVISYHQLSPASILNKNMSTNIFSVVNPAFWNKLWRRTLFVDNDIFFPENVYFEDMPTTPRILANTKTIKIVDRCLYHYLIRNDSITNSFSAQHIIDYLKGFEMLLEYLKEHDLYVRYLAEFKAYVNTVCRFHAHKVIESAMHENEIKQYLRHFLMLKIAFFEFHDMIDPSSQDNLISLLETATSKEDLV